MLRRLAAIFAAAVAAALLLPNAAATAQTDGTGGKIAAMGISPPAVPQQAIAAELPRIRAAGINTGTIDVWWDVDSTDRSSLRRGSITITDADLELAIRRAKQQGMNVILEPKVWCPDCEHHWRGYLDPEDRDKFFTDYTAFIAHYAEIAQRTGVDIMFIGSEMSLVQNETEKWREVARQARAQYGGTLTYGVNWNVLSRVHFWDAVDLVSVSAYFPLSSEERPSLSELKAGWKSSLDSNWRGRRWFDEIVELQRETRKKILFGEIGYLSSTYVARTPYDESKVYETSQELQALAYQAVLETFQNQSWWAGAVWWEWQLTSGDSRDRSYSPRNKLAEQFLKAWYADGWRPTPGQATPRDPLPAPAPAPAPGGATSPAPGGSTSGARPATGGRTQPAPAPAAPNAAPAPTTPGAPVAAAPGTTALGATPGLPTQEQALPDAGDALSPLRDRDVVIPIAFAALLLVLLPASAYARTLRQQPLPFPAELPSRHPEHARSWN